MSEYETLEDHTADLMKLHAERIIDEYFQRQGIVGPKGLTTQEVPIFPDITRLAVIGAGVSGLRVAMRLGQDYPVDVFEASERVGGRLFTFKFPGEEYDYFDVGAMRFPHTKVMRPTFNLFKDLKLPLLPYHMESDDSWLYYNGIRVQYKDRAGHSFGAGIKDGGNVPDDWAEQGYDVLMKIVWGRFIHELKADFKTGYELLRQYDDHSTRSFMAFVTLDEVTDSEGKVLFKAKKKYPAVVINWLETMTFSSGWFDRAFVETILELFAFGEGQEGVDWFCVKNGSEEIPKAMKKALESGNYKQNVTFYLKHQTTAVDFNIDKHEFTVSGKVRSEVTSQEFPEFSKGQYSHAVLAVSPQCMRFIDLSSCKLDYVQRSALLMLQPGPSTKIGMKFETSWWSNQGILGGQSKTDRPVRTVVYPSHGDGVSKVLIASYCWTQDANAWGSLIQGPGSFDEQRLKSAVLRDLADIHNIDLATLEKQCKGVYPFDWNHNSKTMGAYAFFGPSEFTTLYENMTRPAAMGRLHFAGEAISTCHAWVAGAVESADRVVDTITAAIPRPKGTDDMYGVHLGNKILVKQMALSQHLQRDL